MKQITGFATGLLLMLATTGSAAEPGDLLNEKALSLATAKLMIQGCEDYARLNKLDPIIIAIFDAAGNLKLFARQDFARTGSIDFAMVKGRTAAVLGVTTDALGKTDYGDPARPMGIASADGLTIVQGGVPIFADDGTLLGGIGVSGAPAAQDEACGKAGIAAVKDLLR